MSEAVEQVQDVPAGAGEAPAVQSNQAQASVGTQELTSTGGDNAWYGEIKDAEVRDWVQKAGYKTPESALKAHMNAERLVGKGRLPLPDPEKLGEWEGWKALGSPDTPEGYQDAVKLPELPEGMSLDQQFLNQAYEAGAKAKIPPAQMQAMVNLYAEQQKQVFEAAIAQQAKDRAELEALYKEWGATKDDRMSAARTAAKEMGFSENDLNALGEVLGSAGMVKKFAEIGKRMSEGGMIEGINREGYQAELTRVNAEIAALMGSNKPIPAELNMRQTDLYKKVYAS